MSADEERMEEKQAKEEFKGEMKEMEEKEIDGGPEGEEEEAEVTDL